MRVLISGMASEVGTRLALRLEGNPAVESVVGFDADPPRRHLRSAEFWRVDPRDRQRLLARLRDLEPTVVVHLGVYEPNAMASGATALARNEHAAVTVLGALCETGSVERFIVRSGLEVYGRGRGAPTRPDEGAPIAPTTAFGRSLAAVERVAVEAGRAADAPVTTLRLAPLLGAHLPVPLGRFLRMPAVPVDPIGDLPFSAVHPADAVIAIERAMAAGNDGAGNIVSPGAVTPSQAVRLGGRVPVPVVGPGWRAAEILARLAGSPLPDHVRELLSRGRVADGGRAASDLDFVPARSTIEVVQTLYDWDDVTWVASIEDMRQ
jgi:UDP-glucose 4-epimerase